jgi:trigger factor
LNIQTERLENHTARLTVEVDASEWEQAKKDAAAELSKKYRIPGFRQGKAPYNVIARFLGEATILDAAVDTFGKALYPKALEESKVEPIAAGTIEDFKPEPTPTFTYTVPLAPEIDLGDYRSVREDYEKTEVTEEDVDKTMRNMLQREAVVTDSEDAIKVGDRVTVDIHSDFVDGPEEDEEGVDENVPRKGDSFTHEHDAELNLDPENEPILPGFINGLVGKKAGEDAEFELEVPADSTNFIEAVRGRKVHFNLEIKKVQSVALPELNDEFAAKVTEKESEPLNLEKLRERTKEELQKEMERIADNNYANKVLDKIVEQAKLSYHESMVHDRIHEMIEELDGNLRQQGVTLETYQKVTGITHEQLHEQYHENAEKSLSRSLVLGEVLVKEGVSITDDEISAEINKTLADFGENAEQFRHFFDTPQQRNRIANSMVYDRLMARLAKIGKGESLEEPSVATEVEEASEADAAEGETVKSDE